jgi:tRNA (guanine37-N1)-methyltransferase
MRIDVITLFPAELQAALSFGVIGRALEKQIVQLHCTNPRDFATGNYRRVDERVYGGGPGMVLMIEPLVLALAQIKRDDARPFQLGYLSPQGKPLQQSIARLHAKRERIVLLCGRYEGIDQRFIDHHVDEEISIGDYVLSGGELAAAVYIDALVRLIPGVLHDQDSAAQDSFEDGLLDCPHYTRPEHSELGSVPDILRSGDHQKIARWRRMQSLGRTFQRRPDLLIDRALSKQDQALLKEFLSSSTESL